MIGIELARPVENTDEAFTARLERALRSADEAGERQVALSTSDLRRLLAVAERRAEASGLARLRAQELAFALLRSA